MIKFRSYLIKNRYIWITSINPIHGIGSTRNYFTVWITGKCWKSLGTESCTSLIVWIKFWASFLTPDMFRCSPSLVRWKSLIPSFWMKNQHCFWHISKIRALNSRIQALWPTLRWVVRPDIIIRREDLTHNRQLISSQRNFNRECIVNVICSEVNYKIVWIIMVYKKRFKLFLEFNVCSRYAAKPAINGGYFERTLQLLLVSYSLGLSSYHSR